MKGIGDVANYDNLVRRDVVEIFTFSEGPRPNHQLNCLFTIAKLLAQIAAFEHARSRAGGLVFLAVVRHVRPIQRCGEKNALP